MTNKDYSSKRLREIISISAKYGFKKGIGDPKNFRLFLEDLGPSFVKIGQILSTRPDLLDKVYTDELKNLQDNVSSQGFSDMEAVLLEELGPIDKVFSSFNKTPLASASLSEVFRGTLKTGEAVVVKIQRPKVRETMSADLAIIKKLAPFINFLASNEIVDAEEVIRELELAIKKELDFLEEKKNIEKFHLFNLNIDSITSPKVYADHCSSRVLVMDYIDGIKIDQTQRLVEEGYDLEDLSRKLIYNYFQQVFDHGFFHADPHPGNILISNRSIGYIDFGLMGKLDEDMKAKLNTVLRAVVVNDIDLLTKAILQIGIPTGKINFNRLNDEIKLIYDKYIDLSIYSFDIGQILGEIITICRENNIAMPKDITLLAKGMLTIQGVLALLDQDLSIMEVAIPYFKDKILREKLTNIDSFKLATDFYANIEALSVLPHKANRLLDKTLDGNIKLNTNIDELKESIDRINSIGNRLVMAIIIVGLLIASSLNLSNKPLGEIGLLASLMLSLVLLISTYRNRK